MGHDAPGPPCDHRSVYPHPTLELLAVATGLLGGLLLAAGVYRGLGWQGVVGLACLSLAVTSVLSMG